MCDSAVTGHDIRLRRRGASEGSSDGLLPPAQASATANGRRRADLEPQHQRYFAESGAEKRSLEDLLHPLSAVFVPLFFVRTGAQVDVAALASLEALSFGLLLTAAATIGKLACAASVVDRRIVALAMLPRGGGAHLRRDRCWPFDRRPADGQPLIGSEVYAAIILVVILTTLLAPGMVVWRLRSRAR